MERIDLEEFKEQSTEEKLDTLAQKVKIDLEEFKEQSTEEKLDTLLILLAQNVNELIDAQESSGKSLYYDGWRNSWED